MGLALGMAWPVDAFALAPWKADVPYGKHALQRLDIYGPVGDGPFGALVFFHAGGWWNGDKKWFMSDCGKS
jgi:acetyl esterase/lipase